MKKSKIKKLNIKSITENGEVIDQKTLKMVKHYPEKKYLILSKNDFGKNKRINAGIFNKKTEFIVSENHSLLVYNQKNKTIEEANLSEIKKNPENYFMLYFIPIFMHEQNPYAEIDYIDDFGNKIHGFVALNFYLGTVIGKIIKNPELLYKINEDDFLTEQQKLLLKGILTIKNNKIDLDKKFILSSNFETLLGILFEIYDDKIYFDNINIYIFSTILNLLGASYSIRKVNNQFQLRFKLPLIFKYFFKKRFKSFLIKYYGVEIYNRKLKMIRNYKLIIDTEENPGEVKEITYSKYKNIYNEIFHSRKKRNLNIIDYINLGIIELLPMKDFALIEIKKDSNLDKKQLYDFVTEGRDKGTNYFLSGAPLLKNSDGDILAVAAIWTEDAAMQADKSFGIKNKKNTVSHLTGQVFNWIDLDAVLGLYNFTK